MLVIAHRGSNRKAPENSMEAFFTSIDEGATRIELDLVLSKDKNIYICHDDNTSRTASKSLNISEASESEISELRLSNGEPLPRIDTVLPLLDKVELNLELKGNDPALVHVLMKKLEPLPSEKLERIILSSFSVPICEEAASKASHLRRAFLWEPTDLDQDGTNWQRIRDGLSAAKTHIFHPYVCSYDEEMAKFCKSEDLVVYSWAPMLLDEWSDTSTWENIYSLGIDGHCTNFPLELANFLRQKRINNLN